MRTSRPWRTLGAATVTALLSTTLLSAVPARAGTADAGSASRAARASDFYTQDSLWCYYGMNKGPKVSYEQVGKIRNEWVTIGEIHTGSNTKGEFFVGSKVSTTLAGGLSLDAG